ncbi:hypothetical protein CONCODRAFT_13410 [Conidiobolus coronatus NRRL 28638]|uniref:Meiotically up-regulated gene 62 protein-like alpha-beta domain-containing protein n=1 Tax=Conidiobolus coronatus (strain ATCC 28846 / CBS 209.66 / NRRL 28638) TaxID=796925 RepID=A0A137NQS4_CONC2|nr:hypothetical protein CONCODRAFT_13410 [Conidiobolus coronatus NRRL 28638]|eukprot:KXN65116.1 hypothetical protein CONCODRAFT_13410 [Conidiobolus coronatus NRRL 28638]
MMDLEAMKQRFGSMRSDKCFEGRVFRPLSGGDDACYRISCGLSYATLQSIPHGCNQSLNLGNRYKPSICIICNRIRDKDNAWVNMDTSEYGFYRAPSENSILDNITILSASALGSSALHCHPDITEAVAFDGGFADIPGLIVAVETPLKHPEQWSQISNRVYTIISPVHGIMPYMVIVSKPEDLPRRLKNGMPIVSRPLYSKFFRAGELPTLHLKIKSEAIQKLVSLNHLPLRLPQGMDKRFGTASHPMVRHAMKALPFLISLLPLQGHHCKVTLFQELTLFFLASLRAILVPMEGRVDIESLDSAIVALALYQLGSLSIVPSYETPFNSLISHNSALTLSFTSWIESNRIINYSGKKDRQKHKTMLFSIR